MRAAVVCASFLVIGAAACGAKPAPVVDADPARRRRRQRRQAAAAEGQAAAGSVGRQDRSDRPRRRSSRRQAVELPPIDDVQARATGSRSTSSRPTRACRSSSMQLAIKAGRIDEPRARLGVAEADRRHARQGHARSATRSASRRRSTSSAARSPPTRRSRRRSVVQRAARANMATCLELLPEMIDAADVPRRRAREDQATSCSARSRSGSTTPATLASRARAEPPVEQRPRARLDQRASQSIARSRATRSWRGTRPGSRRTTRCSSSPATSTARACKRDLERAFGGWTKAHRRRRTPKLRASPGSSGMRIRLVDKPGQTQTHIRVAQFGIQHDDPRFFDTLVWNYALGGGAFSSRLMKVVRVEGGKTYGAARRSIATLDRGSFVASDVHAQHRGGRDDEADARRDHEDGEGRPDRRRGRAGDREPRGRLRAALPVRRRHRRGAGRRRAARLRRGVPAELSRSRSARSTPTSARKAASTRSSIRRTS